MHITNLNPTDEHLILQIAEMLVAGFAEHWPDAWPDLDSAVEEVRASFAAERISRVALDEQGNAIGWIGGIEQYDGNVWELHPLVVRQDQQRQGIGRALVMDLEACVRERGGLTLWLGTDDEQHLTSLGGADLYQNLWEQIANIKNLGGHPYEFYQKLGYAITGVMPDANGPGKPDIFMAKPIKRD
jgi:aminoglycoside 6'-N-acetyltransferase I